MARRFEGQDGDVPIGKTPTEVDLMLAHNLILVPAAAVVVVAATEVLMIRARRKRDDRLRREEFKTACKLEGKLNGRTTAND